MQMREPSCLEPIFQVLTEKKCQLQILYAPLPPKSSGIIKLFSIAAISFYIPHQHLLSAGFGFLGGFFWGGGACGSYPNGCE